MSLARTARERGLSRPCAHRATAKALAQFDARLMRARVTREAARHDRIADLALSFPAVLVALATGERGPAQTDIARSLVIAGAPLRAVARTLALPKWLRRLPPQAFVDNVGELPSEAQFAFRIANHLPQRPHLAALWIAWVREAYRACDEDFALWAAREFTRQKRHGDPRGLRVLGMYAWYSHRPDLEASRWLARRWHAEMTLVEAGHQANSWLDRLPFAYCPLPTQQSTWHAGAGIVDGFRFEYLATPQDLIETAEVLKNCLIDYAGRLDETDQVWRIRAGNRTVGAFRLLLSKTERGTPALREASGYDNGILTPETHRALYKFLLAWPTATAATDDTSLPKGKPPAADVQAYRQLFKPYWLAKGGRDVVPLIDQNANSPLELAHDVLGDLRFPARRYWRRMRQRHARQR